MLANVPVSSNADRPSFISHGSTHVEIAVAPQRHTIPSLDGLRAIAVSMVILSHYAGWSTPPKHGPVHVAVVLLGQGGLGVSIFFIISGFLITTLLLEEKAANGSIHFRKFYLRRAFRLFPAFYVFLIVAATIAFFAHRSIPRLALTSAAFYFSDYYPYAWIHNPWQAWYVAHTWSLSLEEQFYLVAPFLLNRLSCRRATHLCLATLLLTPFLRWITVETMPVYATADQWYRLLHTNADTLATGCLLAFAFRNAEWLQRLDRLLKPALLLPVAGYLLISSEVFQRAPQWFSALLGVSLTNATIALLLLYVVRRPLTVPGRLLNMRWVRHLGLISYSLYLWQQVCLGPYAAPSSLIKLGLLLACAELSYWAIEQPSLQLRNRVLLRFYGADQSR